VYVKDGYLFNPIVYSIVSFIAQKASSIPWGVYEVKNDKALALYKSMTPGIPQYKKDIVKTKALVQIESHPLNELFIRANVLQSWSELTEQEIGFKLITGNAYTHCIGPEGGNNAGQIKEMWSMPSQIVTIVAGDPTNPIKQYELRGDRTVVIPVNQVIHQKYWTPQYEGGRFLYGISPLQAGRRVITRSNSSYDASVSSFQNMGAYGMITGDGGTVDAGFTPEQAEQVQKALKKKEGPKSAGSKLVTPYNLKWQQFGMSPVDLNMIESDKMDLRSLCMVFHVPSELFGDASNKTYANTKEAGSAVYTNAVIPALTQKRDSLNQFIKTRYKENIFCDFDVSMISELQDDISMLSTALQGCWFLTGNEKRDMLSFGVDEKNPLMNEYMIPAGLTPLSMLNEPLPEDDIVEEAAKQLKLTDY
jgi:HK97 family phage portal protein